ncbi:hypothetical protein [Amycolatopsis sp. CA-230715]|uniref:hypothetical protein n=1 Tax=Amycolatopsis sp. CA-230715 TaxID=2745196 RepID=UPI001C009A86|nr:hypothetical protein [Amycolatopsis sp. CA-230715]
MAVAEHLAELAPLRKRERIPADGYTGDDERLWRIMKLHGLGRTNDYLIELFRSQRDPSAGIAVHTEFFSGVGLTPFEHAEAFSPFHHEIFAVVQDPSATSVTVEEVLWFGDLLFSRAGVRAWDSNSQWRTRFARFYADEEGLHFNWDGEVDIAHDPPAARYGWPEGIEDPLDQRRELVLHRCFVRDPLPADEHDRYPYDDRFSLTSAEWPLRPESLVHVPWSE